MTRPTARVLALLEILQAGGSHSAAELAAAIDVDERTVRRYIGHLTDLDVPIRSVRGRYGGYRLAAGHRMPPLMLTDEEALAVLVGMVAADRADLIGSPVAAVHSAAAKLRRVLPSRLGPRLDALLQVADLPRSSRARTAPEADVLLLIAQAAAQRRAVQLDYVDSRGQASRRTVHPYGLVAHAGRWYLTVADAASGADRTFRVDRVRAVTLLADTFPAPEAGDPRERLLSTMATAARRHAVQVRVQADRDHIERRVPPGLATIEPIAPDEGWVRVRLQVEDLDWVPSLLAWIDRPFVVEEPPALRGHVRALAERLIRSTEDDH